MGLPQQRRTSITPMHADPPGHFDLVWADLEPHGTHANQRRLSWQATFDCIRYYNPEWWYVKSPDMPDWITQPNRQSSRYHHQFTDCHYATQKHMMWHVWTNAVMWGPLRSCSEKDPCGIWPICLTKRRNKPGYTPGSWSLLRSLFWQPLMHWSGLRELRIGLDSSRAELETSMDNAQER